jgi:hypothetical protein
MRVTDQDKSSVFQSDRFFLAEGLWYFATREGVDFGPFTVRSDGEKALLRYLDTQKTMRKLRGRDPMLNEERQWNDQSVAHAAREVADWRLDRSGRTNSLYADRSDKHK